jgi:hypothetical protein
LDYIGVLKAQGAHLVEDLAEADVAMALGNLVIATGYGGNMDYMNAESALLARYSLEPIRLPESRQRLGFNPSSLAPQWAYVDEDNLGKLMLRAR